MGDKKFDFDGRMWDIVKVNAKKFDDKYRTLVQVEEELAQWSICEDVKDELVECFLLHEVIERTLSNSGLIDMLCSLLRQGVRVEVSNMELADLFANSLESKVWDAIKRNPDFFPEIEKSFRGGG